jgi:hypothetical protein
MDEVWRKWLMTTPALDLARIFREKAVPIRTCRAGWMYMLQLNHAMVIVTAFQLPVWNIPLCVQCDGGNTGKPEDVLDRLAANIQHRRKSYQSDHSTDREKRLKPNEHP